MESLELVLGDILGVPSPQSSCPGNAGQELQEWSWQGSEAQDVLDATLNAQCALQGHF